MRELSIDAAGVFASVGLNLGQAMGSLRTKLSRFQEVPVFGFGGEPLVAAPTPILTDLALGQERMLIMGAHALAECCGDHQAEPLPLLLCCPPSSEMMLDAGALMDELTAAAGVTADTRASQVFFGGHAVVIAALMKADELLGTGRFRACVVGGVDTFLDRERLERLMAEHRIAGEASPDGFIPGEAAAFLRLVRRPQTGALAKIRGLGVAEEEATRGSGKPNTAKGMTAAMRAALADAGAATQDISLLTYDLTGERYGFYESSLAVARLKPRRKNQLATWTAALSVGEVGAALGPLTLAYGAFVLRAGGVQVPADLTGHPPGVMYAASSDDSLRGAALLGRVDHA